MTIYRVRSTDGSNTDDGSTWDLAKADLQSITYVAGDTAYVSQSHAQTAAVSITIDTNGTVASPTKIIAGNDAADPPTAVATASVLVTSGSIGIKDSAYIYGIAFEAQASIALNDVGGHVQKYENCAFSTQNNSTNRITTGVNAASADPLTVWRNCTVKFANAAQRIVSNNGFLKWEGGSIASGSTALTTCLLEPNGSTRPGKIEVCGVDLSNMGSACNLVNVAGSGGGTVDLVNCKLPSGWTGNLTTGTFAPGTRVRMHNCDSGDTNYRLWEKDYAGSIKSETTIVRTGGASDGTTSHSLKMESNANAEYPVVVLESPKIVQRVTTGSHTVSVEILHDATTNLTDADIWIDVQYLGADGYPLGAFITDAKADVLATAADQADSSAAWTTTGLTNPNSQKLSVSLTAQADGYVIAKVCLAKASTTVYVDNLLTVI